MTAAPICALAAQLNVNQSAGESKKVMVRHPECEQPVMFVVPQIKVVPGTSCTMRTRAPPGAAMRLQRNPHRDARHCCQRAPT